MDRQIIVCTYLVILAGIGEIYRAGLFWAVVALLSGLGIARLDVLSLDSRASKVNAIGVWPPVAVIVSADQVVLRFIELIRNGEAESLRARDIEAAAHALIGPST